MATGIIVLPLVVGLVASALTGNTMMEFGRLKQPPLAPPAWLFPVAWTILYTDGGGLLFDLSIGAKN